MAYFKNKWAIILGGSSGMGLASAKKLASEGMHLLIIHRDRKAGTLSLKVKLEALQAQFGTQFETYNIDALRPEKRSEVLASIKQRIGDDKVKVLLHAIARGNLKLLAPFKGFEQATGLKKRLEAVYFEHHDTLDQTDFQATLNAMALSLYDWVWDCFQLSLFDQDARILGLTSEGSSKSWRTYAAVSVAKASLESLCRSIALEFAPYGIRCNVLQPGVTDTPSLRMIPGADILLDEAEQRNPFQRTTTPEDVANVVYLLCREEAKWINGAIIPVDGGERIV